MGHVEHRGLARLAGAAPDRAENEHVGAHEALAETAARQLQQPRVGTTERRRPRAVREAGRYARVRIGQPRHRVEPTPASIAAVGNGAHDPLRMYLVVRRGAFADLSRAGELTGAAAVACVREFEGDPELDA